MTRPTKPSLVTLGDFFRFAVRRFRAARLAYGHGTTNARDEAAFLVLEALRLLLRQVVFYVENAESTGIALAELERAVFDVALLDLNYAR